MDLPHEWPKDFAHHRLDVYNVAMDAMLRCHALARSVPRGHRSMADQLKRSSTGVVSAITEGANRRTPAEKADTTARRARRPARQPAGAR